MFRLLGNNIELGKYDSIEECKFALKDYQEIEKAINKKSKIKFEIEKVV